VSLRFHMIAPAGIALLLLQALAGCADYDAYKRCGSGCPGDAQLDAAVRARLQQHRDLAAPNQVYVHTLNGTVYLTGLVATGLQRADAESIAQEAAGAHRVVDNIAITYEGR
jgi:osmotically-inducible protein OsmY